jgi:PAS domain S-box-containing protein
MAVDFSELRRARPGRVVEATLLASALTATAVLAFVSNLATETPSLPTLLFLPVPFLVWAALRFGPAGTSTAFALMVCLVIWGAGHGGGPFQAGTLYDGERPVQLYLTSLGPTLLALAAVLAERQRAERLLRGSEERFSRAFRSSPDAMSISRVSDGQLIDVNDRWEELFGYLREEALGRPLLDLLHPASRDRAEIELRAASGETIRDYEFEAHHRRGERLHLILAMEAVELDGETCRLATLRDVTEQRRAEVESHQQRRQLTHLSRVNLLGELSGALAHELNQPLTAILNNARAAQRFLARPNPDLEQLGEILEEIATSDQRAATVIDRLRALLRKGESGVEQLDLNQVLEETLDFAHGEVITHDVTVSTHFETRLPRISGDRVQLQQLYLNLVNNACEAMTEIEPASRVLRIASAPARDGTVQATISDSGPGIAFQRLDHVFEPFVTTKSTGLGLGLAICRTIVDAHGGRIWVENGDVAGATFFTEFPALR